MRARRAQQATSMTLMSNSEQVSDDWLALPHSKCTALANAI